MPGTGVCRLGWPQAGAGPLAVQTGQRWQEPGIRLPPGALAGILTWALRTVAVTRLNPQDPIWAVRRGKECAWLRF